MKKRFQLFRYQIIPNTSSENFNLFGDVDELIANKNQLFMDAVNQFSGFNNHTAETNYRSLLHEGSWHVGQVGFKRRTRLTNREFQKKNEDNFPSIFFVINNDPDRQLLIIQDVSGLMKPLTFARRIIEHINQALEKHPVEVQVESIVEPTEFWSQIHKAKGRIEAVEFKIDTPNMARISKKLPEKLKELSKATNSKSSMLRLDGGKSRTLSICEDNPDIQGLNSYISSGGGDYKIKLVGVKQEVTKNNSVKTTYIDEVTIEHPSVDALAFALNSVLEND